MIICFKEYYKNAYRFLVIMNDSPPIERRICVSKLMKERQTDEKRLLWPRYESKVKRSFDGAVNDENFFMFITNDMTVDSDRAYDTRIRTSVRNGSISLDNDDHTEIGLESNSRKAHLIFILKILLSNVLLMKQIQKVIRLKIWMKLLGVV